MKGTKGKVSRFLNDPNSSMARDNGGAIGSTLGDNDLYARESSALKRFYTRFGVQKTRERETGKKESRKSLFCPEVSVSLKSVNSGSPQDADVKCKWSIKI